MLRRAVLPLIVVGLFGCETAVKAPAEGAAAPAEASAEKAVEAAPAAEHAAKAEHEKAGEACGEAETKKLENDVAVSRTAADGTAYTHVGGEFTDAPEVAVADLLASPDKWAGKRVTVKGDVSAMCQHERAWFAVVGAGDQSGRQLQIRTAPVFLVPAGSIGKTAKAEGTVEVIEVPAEQARHLAAEHKMGDPSTIVAPVKRVVIRAVGADFI